MPLKMLMSSVPVFQYVGPKDAQELQGICRVLTKTKGEAVLMHGEPVPGMYIVGEGSVGVYPLHASHPLVILRASEAFGEMAFLERSRASATIRAEEDHTRLIVFQHADLAHLLDAKPRIGFALYKGIATTLSAKLRRTNHKIAAEFAKSNALLADFAAHNGIVAPTKLPELIQDSMDKTLAALQQLENSLAEMASQPKANAALADAQLSAKSAREHCQLLSAKVSQPVRLLLELFQSMDTFIQESQTR